MKKLAADAMVDGEALEYGALRRGRHIALAHPPKGLAAAPYSKVSWSESNEIATAQAAPFFQRRGFERTSGADVIDDAAPARLRPGPGRRTSLMQPSLNHARP